jgi:hypothetical protein
MEWRRIEQTDKVTEEDGRRETTVGQARTSDRVSRMGRLLVMTERDREREENLYVQTG